MMNNFVAFILTHGRPNKVITYRTLRRCGYTGKIILLVDNMDKTQKEYIEKYGEEVVIFDKMKIRAMIDQGDNNNHMGVILYARNACFEVAKKLNIKYFIQLDDDYEAFEFRFNHNLDYKTRPIKRLDEIFYILLRFYIDSGITSLAMAQGGDFVGGTENTSFTAKITLKRKAMNSFICSTDRHFQFFGKINEDVNTYTNGASRGLLFLTTNQVSLKQKQTQQNKGGMSEIYLDKGTYIKSFYSIIYQPSSVKIKYNAGMKRIHHAVNWNCTVPKILRDNIKKKVI